MSYNFKVAIFDLDDTLWDGRKLYEHTESILSTLKQHGIKLYVASFHSEARAACILLRIDKYFDDILYLTPKPESTKISMIKEIIAKNQIDEKDIVFFDDNEYNLYDVEMVTAIRTVHVLGGISWYDIYNLTNLELSTATTDTSTTTEIPEIPDFIDDNYYLLSVKM